MPHEEGQDIELAWGQHQGLVVSAYLMGVRKERQVPDLKHVLRSSRISRHPA
jgi:hypothetical protein